ncbi:MAG: hypothetical protein ACOYL6_17760 [Bacteriovoracaceae bacterium]
MKELLLVGLFLLAAYAKAEPRKSNKDILVEQNKNLVGEVSKLKELVDEDKLKDACLSAASIFTHYEQYVADAGMHMESKNNKKRVTIEDNEGQYRSVINMEGSKRRHRKVVGAAVEELAYFSEFKLLCSTGKDQEFINPNEVSNDLKEVLQSLRKQGRKIGRDDVDEYNWFSADYKTGNAFHSTSAIKN